MRKETPRKEHTDKLKTKPLALFKFFSNPKHLGSFLTDLLPNDTSQHEEKSQPRVNLAEPGSGAKVQ